MTPTKIQYHYILFHQYDTILVYYNTFSIECRLSLGFDFAIKL